MQPAQMNRTGAHRDPIDAWCSPETADLVLEHLRRIADTRGVATVTTRGLATDLGISPSTARRALRCHEDYGQIELLRRGTGGRYSSRFKVHGARRLSSSPAA